MKSRDAERRGLLVEAMRKSCKITADGPSRVFSSSPVRMSLRDLQWLLLESPILLANGHVWEYAWKQVIPGVYDVWPDRASETKETP